MPILEINLETPARLQGLLGQLAAIPEKLNKAASNALRRTLKSGKQAARQKIASRYTIATGSVIETLKIRVDGLKGEMKSRGARNPMEKFQHNPRVRINPGLPGGIFASVVKGQGGNIRRAFIQRKGGIWERVGKARFPIRRFKSPAAPQMLGVTPVAEYIKRKMEERYGKNLDHAISAMIGGYL